MSAVSNKPFCHPKKNTTHTMSALEKTVDLIVTDSESDSSESEAETVETNINAPEEENPLQSSSSDYSGPHVGCLACTSTKRAQITKDFQEAEKARKKERKAQKEIARREAQEKKKLDKENKPKEKVKKGKKRKIAETEALPKVDPVMIKPLKPDYDFSKNKFRVSGTCPDCHKAVSSFIGLKDVPDKVLDKLSLNREALIREKEEKKAAPAQKKAKKQKKLCPNCSGHCEQ